MLYNFGLQHFCEILNNFQILQYSRMQKIVHFGLDAISNLWELDYEAEH